MSTVSKGVPLLANADEYNVSCFARYDGLDRGTFSTISSAFLHSTNRAKRWRALSGGDIGNVPRNAAGVLRVGSGLLAYLRLAAAFTQAHLDVSCICLPLHQHTIHVAQHRPHWSIPSSQPEEAICGNICTIGIQARARSYTHTH
jgi:hypothetical protein